MSEQQHNTNPWAEKLQQVSLPEPGESKRQLLDLLDREMPLPPKKDNRRWLLLLLLLLLLIGVCNCPGLLGLKKLPVAGMPQHPAGKSVPQDDGRSIAQTASTPINRSTTAQPSAPGKDNAVNAASQTNAASPVEKTVLDNRDLNNHKKQSFTRALKTSPHRSSATTHKKPGRKTSYKTLYGNYKGTTAGNSKQSENDTSPDVLPAPVETTKAIDSGAHAAIDTATTDSSHEKKKDTTAVVSQKKKTAENKKGWAVAIGLNQSFPVGGQQWVNAGSDGNANIIGDYTPIPQLRYQFNKKWSMELELAIHAPQYTRPLQLRELFDTLSGSSRHGFVYLEKLFYLRVPLSIHYTIDKNWSAGAGVSYGRLKDAVGLFGTRLVRSGRPDSILYSKMQSLKKDSLGYLYSVLQPSDWQWFADINYQWKNISVAIRYNHSTGHFINLPVQRAPIAKAANASLQLSLRYTLWRQKQKKKLPVK